MNSSTRTLTFIWGVCFSKAAWNNLVFSLWEGEKFLHPVSQPWTWGAAGVRGWLVHSHRQHLTISFCTYTQHTQHSPNHYTHPHFNYYLCHIPAQKKDKMWRPHMTSKISVLKKAKLSIQCVCSVWMCKHVGCKKTKIIKVQPKQVTYRGETDWLLGAEAKTQDGEARLSDLLIPLTSKAAMKNTPSSDSPPHTSQTPRCIPTPPARVRLHPYPSQPLPVDT